MPTQLILVLVYFVFASLLHRVYRSRRRLPPGPKGYPIIGNMYDVPPTEEWLAFKEMSERYGSDVIYLNLCGTDVIVLNSRESCKELLENRSLIYSDRPNFHLMNDLVGFDHNFAMMRNGGFWKDVRALFQRELNPPRRHYPSIVDATRNFLSRLADDPERFMEHIRHMAGKIILSTAYGIDVQPANDPFIEIAERGMAGMAWAGNPGTFAVDYIPILKYIPEWCPGAGFKRTAKEYRKWATAMPTSTLDFVKKSMAKGIAKSSIASRKLAEMEGKGTWTPYKEKVLTSALGTMYAGGSDTTVSSLGTFILAMVQNPDIQKKAQIAIDNALGTHRLPEFSDKGSIPYIDAIVMEVLRWRPVVPVAIPHRVTQDDEYKGYHIPAGSTVIGNSWAILHDPTMYGSDTDAFNPERFMKDGVLNPDVERPVVPFGFGRRVCAGRAMAEASIWFAIMSILVCFDIQVPVDEYGERIEPSGSYSSGLLCHPDPFRCEIRPRSDEALAMIRDLS